VFTSLLANFKGTEPCGCKEPGPWKTGTCPVASRSYPANGFGLYDMHGNVWEWCHDAYAPYPREAVTDPTGPEQELPRRVIRGGGWGAAGYACRAAFRKPVNCQDNSLNDVGFRPVRSLASPRK
jgi:sulfatase modifying factor 1